VLVFSCHLVRSASLFMTVTALRLEVKYAITLRTDLQLPVALESRDVMASQQPD
jgi:hypothetical protein